MSTATGDARDMWTPQTPLVQLSPHDVWTLRDAYEGVQIFGGTGSGKTSGSGRAIALGFLYQGMGGLVCCAKPEERETWERYTALTGRSGDLRIFSPGSVLPNGKPARFNFLDYELNRTGKGGGQTENLVNLLSTITEIAEGSGGAGGDRDKYWERAARQMLRNAVDVLSLAGEPMTLDALIQFIADAPRSAAQVFEADWQGNSFLYRTLEKAEANAKTPRQIHDQETAARYWFNQFATMDERPRSSIISTFTSTADMLAHGLAWELMSTDITIIPEVAYTGKIIILDLPLQEYGEVGRVIQGIWKTMFQRAVLRRDVARDPRPVFLWCDESQNFISSYDFEYQATARSARACTVYLTQNLPNYRAKLGAGAHDAALALLGNFQTKIWHANGDYVTNQFAADTIGKRTMELTSRTVSGSSSGGMDNVSVSQGRGQHIDFAIQPHEFAVLRKGGPENDLTVDGIVYQPGKVFNASEDVYLKVPFSQE